MIKPSKPTKRTGSAQTRPSVSTGGHCEADSALYPNTSAHHRLSDEIEFIKAKMGRLTRALEIKTRALNNKFEQNDPAETQKSNVQKR